MKISNPLRLSAARTLTCVSEYADFQHDLWLVNSGKSRTHCKNQCKTTLPFFSPSNDIAGPGKPPPSTLHVDSLVEFIDFKLVGKSWEDHLGGKQKMDFVWPIYFGSELMVQ